AIRALGLTRGYSGYWISHPITWLSGETVHVYPVQERGCEGGRSICPYEYSGDAWYTPGAGPTFLLTTRADPCVPAVPDSLGSPARVVPVDAATTLYVFNDDIAARFARTPLQLC